MSIGKIAGHAFLSGACLALAAAAAAEDRGTMALAPSAVYAQAMSDDELGQQRGGFLGIAFSANYTIFVDPLGNASATGSTTTTTTPPTTFSIDGGTVTASTFVGSFNNASGVFNFVNLNNSNFNIVNSSLVVNIAIVNSATPQLPLSLLSVFGPSGGAP